MEVAGVVIKDMEVVGAIREAMVVVKVVALVGDNGVVMEVMEEVWEVDTVVMGDMEDTVGPMVDLEGEWGVEVEEWGEVWGWEGVR